ncbi:hypothetical protein [Aquabacterium sp. OR-4]|uniref:hypothetical protein n=1 Tax=Aquabacterium sp. OR-4 TaxID=2978127 RepID=UPI0028C7455B|nr:hypothetical protein [Aquabacterium sp. OR-4]MDT7837966.1 hypothetical protein [Aquabacterium sp. OR-4]
MIGRQHPGLAGLALPPGPLNPPGSATAAHATNLPGWCQAYRGRQQAAAAQAPAAAATRAPRDALADALADASGSASINTSGNGSGNGSGNVSGNDSRNASGHHAPADPSMDDSGTSAMSQPAPPEAPAMPLWPLLPLLPLLPPPAVPAWPSPGSAPAGVARLAGTATAQGLHRQLQHPADAGVANPRAAIAGATWTLALPAVGPHWALQIHQAAPQAALNLVLQVPAAALPQARRQLDALERRLRAAGHALLGLQLRAAGGSARVTGPTPQTQT